MADDKNLKGVYETLQREGYTPPEFEVFVKDMGDDSNLKGVHETLKKSGYTPPEFDEFKRDMFGDVSASTSSSAGDVVMGTGSGESVDVNQQESKDRGVANVGNENAGTRKIVSAAVRDPEPEEQAHESLRPDFRNMAAAEAHAIAAMETAQKIREDEKRRKEELKAQRAAFAEYMEAQRKKNEEGRRQADMEREAGIEWDEPEYRRELDSIEYTQAGGLSHETPENRKVQNAMSDDELESAATPGYAGRKIRVFDRDKADKTPYEARARVMKNPEDIYRVIGKVDRTYTEAEPGQLAEFTVEGVSGGKAAARLDEYLRYNPDEREALENDTTGAKRRELTSRMRAEMNAEIKAVDTEFEQWKTDNPHKVRKMTEEELAMKREEIGLEREFMRKVGNLDKERDYIYRRYHERIEELKEELGKPDASGKSLKGAAYIQALDHAMRGDEEIRLLDAQIYNLGQTAERYEEWVADGKQGTFTNYMGGIKGALKNVLMNPFGLTELVSSTAPLMHIRSKLNEDGSTSDLSQDEVSALEDYFLNKESMQRHKMSLARSSGEFTGAMLEIATEFGLNPASGVARRTLAKMVAEVGKDGAMSLIRKSSKLARLVGYKGVDVGGLQVARNLGKVTLAALGEGTAMSLTTQGVKNVNQAVGRMSEKRDENGRLTGVEKESGVRAGVKTVLGSAATNTAFVFPVTFGAKALEGFNNVARTLHVPFGNPVDAFVKMKTGEALSILSADAAGRSELDPTWSEFADSNTNGELIMGLLASELTMGALKGAGSQVKGATLRHNRAKARTALMKSAARGAKAFAEDNGNGNRLHDWEAIVKAVYEGDEGTIIEALQRTAADKDMTGAQKEAVLDYARAAYRYIGAERGYESWRTRGERERAAREAEDEWNVKDPADELMEEAAYDEGYDLVRSQVETGEDTGAAGSGHSTQAAGSESSTRDSEGSIVSSDAPSPAATGRDVVARVREAEQRFEDAFGDEADYWRAAVDEDGIAVSGWEGLSEDQREAAVELINAQASLRGALDAMEDHAEDRKKVIAREIERRTHKDTGLIVSATMKEDGRSVHIVKGDVVMLEDGSGVDVSNSSNDVIILDESGEYKFTSPDQILIVGEAMNPQTELQAAYEAIDREQEAIISEATEGVPESGEIVLNSGENEEITPETAEETPQRVPNVQEYDRGYEEEKAPSALERIPVDEQTGDPILTHESVDADRAWEAATEFFGTPEDALAYVQAEIGNAKTAITTAEKAVGKVKPTGGMTKYRNDLKAARDRVEAAKNTLAKWQAIEEAQKRLKAEEAAARAAETAARNAQLHDEAVARFEEEQRIRAEKQAEQERIGTHAVNPKIKEKWEASPKVDGHPDVITLPDGSTLTGHYVMTEAGAASASHDVNNAFEPTEGFPIDKHGQSVNDRDYKRDRDAQQIVYNMADAYDSRAMQTPVIVSKDGIVLSGNNRTMSGDMAATQGTDGAYLEYLSKYGAKYGFTPEQVATMKHPRVVFVPDEDLPYDANTFSRFNAQEMKSQSKPEAAIKLGKTVPDKVFAEIVGGIAKYDRLTDYYRDEAAAANALGALMQAGVINDKQMPELRTGTSLSAAGKELIENTLIGKTFESAPEAVRQIISMPTLRESIVMGLSEIASNRTLAKKGYDLSKELANAVDLVHRAKTEQPDIYKEGIPVSPFGRMQGLFDDEYGDSRVTDATTLLLADLLNSAKPSDVRKVLAMYNKSAGESAAGAIDLFNESGKPYTKEEILTGVNELFSNGTAREKQELVDAAIADRKQRASAEPAERRGGTAAEQAADAGRRGEGREERAGGEADRVLSLEDKGRSLDRKEAESLLQALKEGAEIAEEIPLTIENWDRLFGESAEIATPLEKVSMGEHQYAKLSRLGRSGKLGMVKPTLERPDIVISERSTANSGSETSRPSSHIYVKTFVNENGDRIYHFTSVTVDRDGKEVSISNQEKRPNRIINLLQNGRLIWTNPEKFEKEAISASDTQKEDAVLPMDSQSATQTAFTDSLGFNSKTSDGKDNALLSDKQGKGAESSGSFTITPTQYQSKKKKEPTPVWLVKFDRDLSKEEKAALDTYIREPLAEGRKTSRGWYDRKEGGYMMRSEEAAKGLAGMLDNAEAVADAQPLSAEDYKEAIAPAAKEGMEPAKAGDSKNVAAPIPMNRVDVEGLFNDLSTKGETKLSDHSAPVKPESAPAKPESKRMIVDDEMRDREDELRSLLGIDDSEGDRGDLFKNPEDFTNKERMQITSLGITYALKYFDQGIVSFPDFADRMVRRMGEKIRPWLKAFYGDARDIPGYDHLPFTPADEVKAFDVMNFDKENKTADPMRTAQGIVAESRAEAAVAEAKKEITEQRNQKRKERDEQTTADTEALAKQAEATASEAEATAESAVDEQSIAAASEKIDEALEKVNEQLALSGYYEAERVDKDFNEAYGYMRNAEKKALADAVKLAKQLVKDLGIEIDKVTGSTTAKKSKKRTAVTANIAPAGGDISIRLPLNEGRELSINIYLDPTTKPGDPTFSGDNLQVSGIMYRVENPNGTGHERYGSNSWASVDGTYSDLLHMIQRETYRYLPERSEEEGEYRSGDSIQYSANGGKSWIDGKVVEVNHDGSLKLDTGLAPVLYVNATLDQVRRKEGLAKAEPSKKEPEKPQFPDPKDTEAVSEWLSDNSAAIWEGVDAITKDAKADTGLRNTFKASNDDSIKEADLSDYVERWLAERIEDMMELHPATVKAWYDYDQQGIILSTIAGRIEDALAEEAKRDKKNETVNGFKRGDEILWDRYGNGQWEKQTITDFDEAGRPILDSFGQNWITEVADWGRIKPVEGKEPKQDTPTEAPESAIDQAIETLTGRKRPVRKTEVKPKQVVGDLFGGLFDKPVTNNEQKETELRPRPGTGEREGGHEPRQDEPVGTSQRNEDGGTDGRGMAGRGGSDTMPDTGRGSAVSRIPSEHAVRQPERKERKKSTSTPQERLPEAERKNTHNNRAERGTDYAPKGVDARIKANIKAIELAQELLESGQQATPEQMGVLRQFSGWGGLGKAFNDAGYSMQIKKLLGSAYEDAVKSRKSAYYTPSYIIDTMWDIARAMGFKGGNVLEGSAGIGNILGLMPQDMSERSNIHAVEYDSTTGGILSLLYPDAKVDIQGFEATKIPNGSVDLSITNVPFITGWNVADTSGDKDLSRKFRDIHDFCIAKNIRKLKPGGIGIFITSSGTLDNSDKLRAWVTNEGVSDVVGAFRMNNQTFGGTGATSDIIVVRKRINGQKSPHAIDVSEVTGARIAEYDTGEVKKEKGKEVPVVKTYPMRYNKYFFEHPENMAGEMMFNFEKGETFQPTSRALFPVKGKDQGAMLKEWAGQFSDMDFEASPEDKPAFAPNYDSVGNEVKTGSMIADSQGRLCTNMNGTAVPVMGSTPTGYSKMTPEQKAKVDAERVEKFNRSKIKGRTRQQCLKDYNELKKALADVLQYQTENADNEGLEPLLKKLNRAFDRFVSMYGNLHKNTQLAWLRNDVDYPSILALESFEERPNAQGERTRTYGKTDIFSRRVVEKEVAPKPENVKDGIIASIYMNGRIDLPYIAEALGRSPEEVKKEIISSGLGFENPNTTDLEVSYEYLSGNVREKLRQAQDNNEDGRYTPNIKALERVIPMNIPAHLIEFALGSSWITPKLYEDFIKERTGVSVRLKNAGGTWFVGTPKTGTNTELNRSQGIFSEMFKSTIFGHQLMEAAITNRSITVSRTYKHSDGTSETVTDKDATQACAAKIDEIRQDFKDWARQRMQQDPEMSDKIERVYNEKLNNYVARNIPEEFIPEHFGGAAHVVNGKPFKLRPHQAKAVIRGTMQSQLLAHEVGTGKTYTLISTAMEMRRLGTARKPMIVVQNATVGQFVESAKALYPNARILTIEEADRTSEGRKNFYAKIKYNDWDMIVVPQSVFELIPDSEERQIKFIQDKIEEKLKVLEDMKEEDPAGKSMIVRQAESELEKRREELNKITLELEEKRGKKKERDEKREAQTKHNAEVRAMEMLDRETDDVENFDEMGIDAILVDEAHEYKHLGFSTAMQRGVKGVDASYSKKAQGVYLKTLAVKERNNGRNVIFATGTPISNTAAEIWTFMRYLLDPDMMKEYGIYYFDDFVRNFGNLQQMLEFTTSGKFKENNRFAGYVNLPELVRIWSGAADTVLTREAGGVNDKIPKLKGGKPTDIYLPQTKALRSVMLYVRKELEAYENMTGKEKKQNSHIPLVMYGIAKAAAVDARLVVAGAEDDPNSKTNACVRHVLQSLDESKAYKGTYAIFADNYQNKKSGFNLYADIREKLIKNGVPEEQIVIMRSNMSVKKKLEIFDKVNRGDVRVILGSTFTLGTGVNIQERLHKVYHLDAPNRPMDYTQRNGRLLRQGNLHNLWGIPVEIVRFGVEDSLDVTAYQRLKTKGAIADAIMNGKELISNAMENRSMEEDEDVFGDITAQLSGSEYAMLKNQAEKQVRKYTSNLKQWEAQQTYIHNQLPRLRGQIKSAEQRIEEAQKQLEVIGTGRDNKITIGSTTYPNIDAMADLFTEHNKRVKAAQDEVREGSGERTMAMNVNVGGIDFTINTKVNRKIANNGQLSFESERNMTYSCEALGMEDVPVSGSRLKAAIEDIVGNVMNGDLFRERIETANNSIERMSNEVAQLESQKGKPFEHVKELEEAEARLEEYTEKMKAELAEKEAKYADIDATVEAAEDVALVEEEEEEETEERKLYREMEAADEILNLEPIEIEPNNLTKDELRREYNNLPSVIKDGREIEFYHSAFKKIYKPGGLFGQIVPVLDEVLEQSVLAYSEGDNLGGMVRPDGTVHKEHTNVISFDNYVGKVSIEGKEYYVRTTVQRGYDGRNGTHSFFVTGVDMYEKTADFNSSPGYPRATEVSGKLTDDGLTIPDFPPVERTRPIVDAKLQQFFEKVNLRQNEKEMEGAVKRLSEKLHTPMRIISRKEAEAEGYRRKKGWYDRETGQITVVADNHRNVGDIADTAVHEAVGHHGLRQLFGSEEKLNNFLDEAYNISNDRIKAEIDRRTEKMIKAEIDRRTEKMIEDEVERLREKMRKEHEARGENPEEEYYPDMAKARIEAEKQREQIRRDATEEYAADLGMKIGEEGFERMDAEEQTFWGKLKGMLQKALDRLLAGLKLPKMRAWTDKEWSYVLWKSWRNLREGRSSPGDKPAYAGPMAEAEDIVMRERMLFNADPLIERTPKRERIAKLRRSKPVEISGEMVPSGLDLTDRKGVKTALKGFIKGEYTNEDDGTRIHVSNKGINEVTSHGMTDEAHVKSLFAIPEMLRKSIFIDERKNEKDHTDYDVYRYYVCGLKIDGEDYTAKLVVGQKNGDSYYDHRLSQIEKGKLIDSLNGLSNSGAAYQRPNEIGYKGTTLASLLQVGEGEKRYLFRDSDLGLEETITKMKADAAAANGADFKAKQDAMRAIGGNLSKLRQAMARQREYDITTVKSMTDLSKILLDAGLLDDLSKYETKRILSAIKDAVGREDTSKQVQRLMDIMVDNQLRMGANYFGKLLSVKGSRIDARGIEVQGELDPDGQTLLRVFNRSKGLKVEAYDANGNLYPDCIVAQMNDAMNRMSSTDQALADKAALEYAGLQIARQYVEEIRESKNEEKELRKSIDDYKAERNAEAEDSKKSIEQARVHKDAGRMTEQDFNLLVHDIEDEERARWAAFKQYAEATNDAIRQNKIERAEAYRSLSEQLGGVLGESVERAKQWREAEKQRVEEIHHNANSDMKGRPTNEHHKADRLQKFVNNGILRFLLAPLGTFDQMLRMFGSKSVRGEGYLWNRYMRGWVDCTEKEYTGYQEALKTLDKKVSEVFGKDMKWGDLFAMERRMPKASVRFWDGGEMRDHELTQGNLLYIYMTDKMTDGRMKLRRMGITEDDVERIKDFVDPRFIQLADWMQEEYLTEKRNGYNEVYKRMFGTSMAAIENYFPLKILANARMEDVDVADDTGDNILPATSTGSIIKRKRNNLALDVTGADAFSVILDHIQQMERWAAFAEYNRDLNTLLSYKRFRNQVMNMTSAYGAGETLWTNFRNVASMAAGAYRPPIAPLDKAAVNVAKGVTAAKVSFRMFTALKQFLSMPAYVSDSNPIHLAANIANPYKAWKWSMENLPLFEKRWKSRMAGDPRLLKSDMDWKMWRSRIVEVAGRVGMSPNAFVDALTVAIGARSMYQTKLAKYKRYGYTPEQARKRALQDATILFNQTQQSSENAFLSTMHVDRSWLSVLFTVFRNSSMSYTRQLYDAMRNIGHRLRPGYKGMTEEFMAKQMRRDGIDPDQADRNAKQEYRRGIIRDLVRVGVFGYALQFAWNLGAYLPYLLFGKNADEKDKMWDDVLNHSMFGSVEGLTGGDVMSAAGEMWMNGEGNPEQLTKDMPLASDVVSILRKMDKDYVSAMNDVVNLLVQSGLGFNPQSLTDAAVAVMDYCGEDAQTSRECALLISRIINCPQSQIDKIYFDEIDATGEEAATMIPEEIAERYVEYKLHRNAPLTGWAYSEGRRKEAMEKQRNKAKKTMKERLNSRLATEQTRKLLEDFDEVSEKEKELNRLKKSDREAYLRERKELWEATDIKRHNRVKRYNHDIKRLTEKWMNAKTPQEADSIARTMLNARERMLIDVDSIEAQ